MSTEEQVIENQAAEEVVSEEIETPEQEESATPENDGDAAANEDEGKERRNRVQKRINELTKQKGEAQREAERLRQEKAEMEQRLRELQGAANPRPKADDFDSYSQYEDALVEWAKGQQDAGAEPAEQTPTPRMDPEQQEAMDAFQNAALDAADRFPNLDQVVASAPVLSFDVFKAATEAERAAEVLYYLGTNHDESARLSQLSGAALAREMGRLEARIESGAVKLTPQQAPTKPATSAPPPIDPVSGGSKGTDTRNPDDLPIDEWMKREQARMRKRLGKG